MTTASYDHGTFCWVDLMTPDIAAAQQFYGQFFTWSGEPQDTEGGPPYVIFKHASGGRVAGLGQMPPEMTAQGIPPLWNSYINVDDVQAVCDKVTQLGGTVTMPPMQVLQAGTMASIADPTVAHVMLWQKNQHAGAELHGDVGAFCWNELATRDVKAAMAFFTELFGWQFQKSAASEMTYFSITNNGCEMGGIIEMTEQWAEVPPHWMVYFTVADMDAAITKLNELGSGVCVQPFDVDGVGRIAVVNDPQGGTFSIIQMHAVN